jgi:hypothetical protein
LIKLSPKVEQALENGMLNEEVEEPLFFMVFDMYMKGNGVDVLKDLYVLESFVFVCHKK